MKQKLIIYIGLLLVLSNCGIINPDLRYTPKNSDGYYFPELSKEFKIAQSECIRLKKYPCDFKEPNDTLNDFVNEWYSKHLKSLKEPILFNQKNKEKKVIRFTNLGTWTRPFSYRIENDNGKITGVYNKTKGLGGYEAGRRIEHETKELNLNDWDMIILKIDSIDFWNIQTHDQNTILDGEEWILEVLIDNRYHVVTRNSPEDFGGEKYAELCKLVINKYKGQ